MMCACVFVIVSEGRGFIVDYLKIIIHGERTVPVGRVHLNALTVVEETESICSSSVDFLYFGVFPLDYGT